MFLQRIEPPPIMDLVATPPRFPKVGRRQLASRLGRGAEHLYDAIGQPSLCPVAGAPAHRRQVGTKGAVRQRSDLRVLSETVIKAQPRHSCAAQLRDIENPLRVPSSLFTRVGPKGALEGSTMKEARLKPTRVNNLIIALARTPFNRPDSIIVVPLCLYSIPRPSPCLGDRPPHFDRSVSLAVVL